jgi:hypothetical protein
MCLLSFFRTAFCAERIVDETIWHKRMRAPLFSRAIDGKLMIGLGQVCRRRNGKWEYAQDEPTRDELDLYNQW